MTNDLLFILIATIISAILGYIIGYYTCGSNKSKSINGSQNASIQTAASGSAAVSSDVDVSGLQSKLKACEDQNRAHLVKISELENHNTKLAAINQNVANQSNFAAPAAAASVTSDNSSSNSNGAAGNFDKLAAIEAMGKKISQDDLKIVEGIGPKISSILNNNGIFTWKELSQADPVKIKEYLLKDGGELYRIHEPGTWPDQARMAYENKWQELASFQENLKGGKLV